MVADVRDHAHEVKRNMKKYVLVGLIALALLAVPMAAAAAQTITVVGTVQTITTSINCGTGAAFGPMANPSTNNPATGTCTINIGSQPWTLTVTDNTANCPGFLRLPTTGPCLTNSLQVQDYNGNWQLLAAQTPTPPTVTVAQGMTTMGIGLSQTINFQQSISGEPAGQYVKVLTLTLTG